MERLTPEMRIVLTEVGQPGEFAHDRVFQEAIRKGWGYWSQGIWHVTNEGKRALQLDTNSMA
jgi:hypothetical protein